MAKLLPYITLFITGLLVIGLVVVIWDPMGYQQVQRDMKRQQDVEAIAYQIEEYAKENGKVPDLSAFPKQIGTVDQGCQLQTKYCSVETDQCLNLHPLMGDRILSLPSDLKIGSYYKTGYTISFDADQEQIEVTACGTEGESVVQVQKSLKGLLLTASEAATLKNINNVKN